MLLRCHDVDVAPEAVAYSSQCELIAPCATPPHSLEVLVKLVSGKEALKIVSMLAHVIDGRGAHVLVVRFITVELVRTGAELAIPISCNVATQG